MTRLHLDLRSARLAGRAYEERLGREPRRRTGSFYTPEPFVKWLVEQALLPVLRLCAAPEQILGLRVADPACGAGYFLIEAGWALAGALADRTGLQQADCLPIVQTCLTGVDVDGDALAVARGVLPGARLVHADGLTADWGGQYDVILGNPPFGGGTGRANLASRFLLHGLERVRTGGRIGLILPKSCAHIAAYASVRAAVPPPSALRDLGRGWGEVGLEQIAYVGVRQEEDRDELWQRLGVWPLYLDREACALLDRVWQAAAPLEALCLSERGRPLIFRGLPWQSRHDLLTDRDDHLPVLGGRHITHFAIRPGPYRRLPPGIAPARMRAPRVLAKRLVSSCPRIEAAWDRTGHLTFDTVTNILPGPRLPADYLTGILNSRFAAFYLNDVLFNRSRLSVDLDLPYLGRLPVVPWAGTRAQREIGALAGALSSDAATGETVSVAAAGARAAIDQLVLQVYGISDLEDLIRARTAHIDRTRRNRQAER